MDYFNISVVLKSLTLFIQSVSTNRVLFLGVDLMALELVLDSFHIFFATRFLETYLIHFQIPFCLFI